MKEQRINIAIDGPAGAGKSTVARMVAEELSILHLDTGAMYRAMALKALRLGISPGDASGVLPLLPKTEITVENIDGVQHTYLDGEDVSMLIRTPEVSKGASDIGVIPEVRIKLAESQREFAKEHDVIMDGREIGSFVLPDAPYKFYVTASADERARRRLLELQEKGLGMDKTLESLRKEILARDHTDSTRAFAPLVRVPDAVLIDTTNMSASEAAAEVLRRVNKGER
ncbi:MAG: (d)CMP kinase [bacterium]|nr:(d)CMP kinase [bacterium]